MSNDPLLIPYKIKNLEIKNRIMTSAHEHSYAEDGFPKERYRSYHAQFIFQKFQINQKYIYPPLNNFYYSL